MSRVCQITGKRPIIGNNRSRALNATKRFFLPNVHFHRFWLEREKRFITLRVSAKGMRIIDKKGIEQYFSEKKFSVKKIRKSLGRKSHG